MLKVNRKVEYGLMALKHMAQKPQNQLSTVREICDRYGTPFDPLAHVLRVLNAQGLLRSEQGAHGGYRIVGDLDSITLNRFIQIIEGQVAFTGCLKGVDPLCDLKETCNIQLCMTSLNHRLLDLLSSLTLGQMLREEGVTVPPPAN